MRFSSLFIHKDILKKKKAEGVILITGLCLGQIHRIVGDDKVRPLFLPW